MLFVFSSAWDSHGTWPMTCSSTSSVPSSLCPSTCEYTELCGAFVPYCLWVYWALWSLCALLLVSILSSAEPLCPSTCEYTELCAAFVPFYLWVYWALWSLLQRNSLTLTHTCQPTQFTSIKYCFFIILGRYSHTGKWIQENIIFMRFCCFKLSKKIEKLSNEQPMNTITKRTLAGRVHYAKKSHQKWDLKLCMHI